jgi:hypothetical protein
MENISGFGLLANLTASRTFPNGFQISKFADDTDPLDAPDLEVAETAFGLNGDMVTWTRPTGIEITVSVLPNSDEEANLAALVEANRVAKKKPGARDVINIVLAYPNGDTATCSTGVVVTGPVIQAVASTGRMKTRQFKFRFEQVSRQKNPVV